LWYGYSYPNSAVGTWYAQHWGKANQNWLCPNAATLPAPPTANPFPGPWAVTPGTVNTPWHALNWVPSWWSVEPPDPMSRTHRAGSYGPNDWVNGVGFSWWRDSLSDTQQREFLFTKEQQILHTSQTPAFADGIAPWWNYPREEDIPAANLQTGDPFPDHLW